jgi:hypothetical protein
MSKRGDFVLGRRENNFELEVRSAGSSGDMLTMLVVEVDGIVILNAGFGGPSLYPDHSGVNYWTGSETGTQVFLLARMHPDVMALRAETTLGERLELSASDVHTDTGLRYAARALPDGHALAGLTAVASDGTERRLPSPWAIPDALVEAGAAPSTPAHGFGA